MNFDEPVIEIHEYQQQNEKVTRKMQDLIFFQPILTDVNTVFFCDVGLTSVYITQDIALCDSLRLHFFLFFFTICDQLF